MAARFRINPVEIVIFLLVLGGFGLSLYGLYAQTASLRQSNSVPASDDHGSLDRVPASMALSE